MNSSWIEGNVAGMLLCTRRRRAWEDAVCIDLYSHPERFVNFDHVYLGRCDFWTVVEKKTTSDSAIFIKIVSPDCKQIGWTLQYYCFEPVQ